MQVLKANLAFLAACLKGLFVTGSILLQIGLFKYFVRSFLIKFEYKGFSEYFQKSLFKEILLFVLRLISIDSRTTCFVPKSLLMSEDFSKIIKKHFPWILLQVCKYLITPPTRYLFEKSSLISNNLGIKQVLRESIKISLKINNIISLNRD